MEEDEEHQSLQSSADFLSLAPPSSSPPPILPTDDSTVAVVNNPSEFLVDFLSLALPSSSPPPNLPTDDSTVAVVKKPYESPSRNAMSLAVHTPSIIDSGGGGGNGNINERSGGGGGGEINEYWTDEATSLLINAWADQVYERGGNGYLNQQDWEEVAKIVNDSGRCNFPKTVTQCKNKINGVKIKYRKMKAKITSGDQPSE